MICCGRIIGGVAAIATALVCCAPVWAAEDTTELAKKTQNPVADLISIPLQNNFNFGMGPKNVTQYVLNVQPVIPIKLTSEWNLITRTILPIINQPSPADGAPVISGWATSIRLCSSRRASRARLSGVSDPPSPCPRRRTRRSAAGSGARVRPPWRSPCKGPGYLAPW